MRAKQLFDARGGFVEAAGERGNFVAPFDAYAYRQVAAPELFDALLQSGEA